MVKKNNFIKINGSTNGDFNRMRIFEILFKQMFKGSLKNEISRLYTLLPSVRGFSNFLSNVIH